MRARTHESPARPPTIATHAWLARARQSARAAAARARDCGRRGAEQTAMDSTPSASKTLISAVACSSVEFRLHRAVGENALADRSPQVTSDDRKRLLDVQVVQVEAMLGADLQGIPEALGDQQRSTRRHGAGSARWSPESFRAGHETTRPGSRSPEPIICSMPLDTLRVGLSWSVRIFAVIERPVSTSMAKMSVKVPPMSVPMKYIRSPCAAAWKARWCAPAVWR